MTTWYTHSTFSPLPLWFFFNLCLSPFDPLIQSFVSLSLSVCHFESKRQKVKRSKRVKDNLLIFVEHLNKGNFISFSHYEWMKNCISLHLFMPWFGRTKLSLTLWTIFTIQFPVLLPHFWRLLSLYSSFSFVHSSHFTCPVSLLHCIHSFHFSFKRRKNLPLVLFYCKY